MKTLILCTLLLGITSCVPANSTNNDNNPVISSNDTTENQGNSTNNDNNPVISSNDTTESQEFRAFGTEPFWSINVSQTEIVYSSLGSNENQTFPYVKPLAADGRNPDTVRVYKLGDKEQSLLIIRKVDNCSDGMSDNLYPYSALFIKGDMVLEGCAREGEE
ncbi:hypothetical protein VB620_19225 [Nodularia harveyana UHCC-0300]|uniref:Lipoprotein n=1 Tax=Nodularia harveyana UHCC-0300 TaxID=2974287 RepID=A0ABU5UIR6_9CYAN|nr:hypothetical protein [Nodularia harveyana]MEA5583463.1 hypothetical protein [Nodularia harveyana UHCC-0300]